jgi:succinate dehydrogenase / fumarate reductase, cytochrome b subunit
MFKQFITSSLGRKYLMALTGAILLGFVLVHLLGNLQVFLGAEQINAYAHLLKSKWPLLWTFRLVLLAAALTHVSVGIWLFLDNWRARPVGYRQEKIQQASLASRTMIYSGALIFSFILFHLLHYTLQWINPEFASFTGRIAGVAEPVPDVYRMMNQGFYPPGITLGYILAVALLAWHLSHGIPSLFQSLGWRNDAVSKFLNGFGWLVALFLFLGLSIIPAAIFAAVRGVIYLR